MNLVKPVNMLSHAHDENNLVHFEFLMSDGTRREFEVDPAFGIPDEIVALQRAFIDGMR